MDLLRVLLFVLVGASFAAIAIYVLVSVAAGAATLLGAGRYDRSADDLDRVLTEILGPRTPGSGAEPGRSRPARRR